MFSININGESQLALTKFECNLGDFLRFTVLIVPFHVIQVCVCVVLWHYRPVTPFFYKENK